MCGIVGVVGYNGNKYLEENLNLLDRRGPDSSGVLQISDNFIMGATRLAMVDPHPRSNQPMIDSETGNVIVFNGEVYNFLDLKKKLELSNTVFKTESDTEVLLKSMSIYGATCVDDFQGMFAFAFYNRKENTLILSRDYLGKKPLFYSLGKDFLIFSSQIDVIKKFIKTCSIDNVSLSNYLKLGYVVNPRTMYSEIKSVMPGEFIIYDLNVNEITCRNNFVPKQILSSNFSSINENLQGAFLERTIGQENFALSMSGGIDSTILALIALQLNKKFVAYTMNWQESDKTRYNEDAKNASLICEQLGIQHHLVDMPTLKEIPDQLVQYVKAMGEPNSNPSGISMMSLYSQISDAGNRLVITGDGADEVFGGYGRYKIISKMKSLPSLNISEINKFFSPRNLNTNLISKILMTITKSDSLMFWLYWQQLAGHNYLKNFYREYRSENFEIFSEDMIQVLKTKNKVAFTMFKDLKIWLSMESNNKLDRISMYNSIEARSPFQAEKVIGAGFSEMKKNNFRVLDKKILTRNYPELQSLPINKTKLGFVSPVGHWLRHNPDLISQSIRILKLNFDFDMRELDRLTKAPIKGDYTDFRFLWNLIVLAYWHEST
jgi:asparagine synthase (glutamine-hydrolysing)